MMRRSRLLLTAAAFASAAAVFSASMVGCGSDVSSEFDTPPTGEAGPGDLDGMAFAPTPDAEAGTQCTSGKACADGGVCAGNVCCSAKSACGDVCCGGTEVCSFQKCAVPGAVCHDSSECGTGQYCEFTLGSSTDGGVTDGGAEASCVSGVDRTGRCLPRPPDCAPDAGSVSDGGVTCLEKCEYKPATTFTPTQKFAWGGQLVAPFATDVMMAPNVVALAAPLCPGPTGVVVTVRNIGEALVPAGVVVGVYGGVPNVGVKVGSVTTTRALYPAESEPLELTLATVPATVYTIVDDGAPPHPAWHECRTDDNISPAVSTACSAPH